jgi:preprotein translocase subunit SecG
MLKTLSMLILFIVMFLALHFVAKEKRRKYLAARKRAAENL